MDQTDRQLLDAAPAILEASSEAIATIDKTGDVTGCNSQFQSLLGISAPQCKTLNIRDVFHDLDISTAESQRHEEFEPVQLGKPDGTTSWVLVKVLPVGNRSDNNITVLVHDPDTIRRIIDRLDYIENYDVGTGLLNRRKGIVEFQQLQASNLSGGCFLVKTDANLVDARNVTDLEDCLRSLARAFNLVEEQSVLCRLSSLELLFIYTAEQPLSTDSLQSVVNELKSRRTDSCDLTLWLSYLEWSGSRKPVNLIIDQLKDELTSIDAPNLLPGMFHYAGL